MDINPIFITKPFLPPLDELMPYLEQIWENKIVTNNGPLHNELELKLCDYLGIQNISLFANGTVALVTALKALEITGEVITTPYSFVATSHSLLWNGIKPVFVDIQPKSLNIDPEKIEEAITPQTSAILAVHCYGHPCDVDKIESIAKKHNLKVIYDAAHAFGVECHCGSLLNHGDISILSLHATKVFNTFEGGAVVCNNPETKIIIDQLKNFGITDETIVNLTGINGKMSEFNSALGLLQLKYIDQVIHKRKEIDNAYRTGLADVKGIHCLGDTGELISNYAYFPILVNPEYSLSRDELYENMKEHGVHLRRYFYPLISEFPMYRGLASSLLDNLPVATQKASQVLCLPIYPDLPLEKVNEICNLIKNQ